MKKAGNSAVDDDTRAHMLTINRQQKDFYESRFDASRAGTRHQERAANTTTNWWSALRHTVMQLRAQTGTDAQLEELHRTWLTPELPGAHVLDLGCFSGNPLSLWIAERAERYTGVDLSEQAIAELNDKLTERGLAPHAQAVAQDFLANDYPDHSFDLVYARSVLHHFQDISVVLREIQRVLRPGGLVITFDPLATEPFNRFARAVYRPFQTDRSWEWPFTRKTLYTIVKSFTVEAISGYGGMSKSAYPFLAFPPTQRVGQRVSRWATAYDARHTNHLGLPLYLCWGVTFRLRYQGFSRSPDPS